MGDIQTRPFSKNYRSVLCFWLVDRQATNKLLYSGLINQSVIGLGLAVLCVTGQELMKRRRRGKALVDPGSGLVAGSPGNLASEFAVMIIPCRSVLMVSVSTKDDHGLGE